MCPVFRLLFNVRIIDLHLILGCRSGRYYLLVMILGAAVADLMSARAGVKKAKRNQEGSNMGFDPILLFL